jgi:hypothetical protein
MDALPVGQQRTRAVMPMCGFDAVLVDRRSDGADPAVYQQDDADAARRRAEPRTRISS